MATEEHLNATQREFKSLMEAARWSAAETARQLKLSRSGVSQILSGKNTPTPQTMELLRIKALEVTGYPKREEEFIVREEAAKIVPMTEGRGPYWGTTHWAPIISEVAAGTGREFLDAENAAPRILVNCPDPNSYCVVVWGDSMMPIYQTGDVLVIAPGIQVNVNDLVVFRTTENEPFFKQYLGVRGGVHRFASFNPNHPVKELSPGELLRMHPIHHVIRPLKGKIF